MFTDESLAKNELGMTIFVIKMLCNFRCKYRIYVYSEKSVSVFSMGRENWKPTLEIGVKKTMPKSGTSTKCFIHDGESGAKLVCFF